MRPVATPKPRLDAGKRRIFVLLFILPQTQEFYTFTDSLLNEIALIYLNNTYL